MHQISIEQRPIFLNLRVARRNFVEEGFEYTYCLTFGTDRLLAFTKLRSDP